MQVQNNVTILQQKFVKMCTWFYKCCSKCSFQKHEWCKKFKL